MWPFKPVIQDKPPVNTQIEFNVICRPSEVSKLIQYVMKVNPEAKGGIISIDKYARLRLQTDLPPVMFNIRDEVLGCNEEYVDVTMMPISELAKFV